MDFLDIEISKSLFIKILVLLIIFVISYLACSMSSLLIFKSYKLGANTEVVGAEKVNTHIDLLERNGGKKIEISGWAYKEDEPLGKIKASYVLKHQETDENVYLMRTQVEENINLLEDEEHKMAGLHAQCLTLGIPKGWYDIYVLYQSNGEDLLVNTLISVEV